MRTRYVSPAEALEGRSVTEGDCRIWTGAANKDGYGLLRAFGKPMLAHRVAYILANGDAIDGVEVDHICGRRACVNPAHLRPADRKRNMENQQGAHRNSKSGIRGVYWMAAKNRWAVQVRHNKKSHYAGLFDDLAEAESVAIALRNKLFTHNDADRSAD